VEVRPGYKQTEAGVIPADWDATPLGELASVTAGGTPSRTNANYWNGDIPWITTSEVDFYTINHADQFITKEGLNNSAAKVLPPGTLLMALYGQGKTRGKIGILGIEAATNQACAAISLKHAVSREFIFHFLASRYDAIRNLSNTGNQENLNSSLVRSIPVLLPPEAEQRAIAAALSDADALLEALTRLIAKKRDLKQAAMQQLLTGQTRLPGFRGEWEVKTLGDLGATYGGLTGKTKSDFGDGTGRYITFMNVMTNVVIDSEAFEQVRVSPAESQNRVLKGDLLFNGSSETPEEVAMCAVLTADIPHLFLNSFCFGLRLRPDCDADGLFLAYYLRSKEGRELMKSLAQGSTRYNLSKVALLNAPLRLPSHPEQTAIAAILSDMDAELSALEARRDKARAFKQAMMQELLIGRTRLV
jgi:type I restriction enzyme, S subunit